jgi:hypothetical protein
MDGNRLARVSRALLLACTTLATSTMAPAAHAAIHLWKVNEIYSNADGTIQYVELFTNSDFQNIFSGTALTSTNGVSTQSVTFNQNTSTATSNKTYLIATPAFAALNQVTPDFTIPAGFLYPTNGSVSFGAFDTASYAALPTDGVNALHRASFPSFGAGVIGTNSPKNFAGASGALALPGAPTITSVIAGDRLAQLRFAAPGSTGSAAISGYRARCNDGGGDVLVEVARSPATLSGLTNGVTTNCRVAARSALGSGPESAGVDVAPSAIAAPALLAAVSRGSHGAAGGFDVDLDVEASLATNPGIEPRGAAATPRLVLTFNVDITDAGSVTLADAMGSVPGSTVATVAGRLVEVQLIGVPSMRRFNLQFAGLNGTGASASLPIAFFPGDVNGSGKVSAADVSAVKSRVSQAVDAANARFDVNLDGAISSTDVSIVKSRSGQALD